MMDTSSTSPMFVRTTETPRRAPPVATTGLVAWARTNLAGNLISTTLTAIGLAIVLWFVPALVRFVLIDAVWFAPDGAACRAPGAGACWAFVGQKLAFFRYGSYPLAERWRVDLTLMLGAVLMARLLWRTVSDTLSLQLVRVVGVPLLVLALTPGLETFGSQPLWAATLLGLGVVASLTVTSPRVALAHVAGIFFLAYPVVGFILLHGASFLTLSVVDTSLWGGIFVTLLISIVGIVASLPLGIVLALGRRSNLPIVKAASTLFIEVVRGVPLITVLFMANTMLPLFMPEAYAPDRLLRPLIGVMLFAAAYMAETVRGGLQALPKGQGEAAFALGLSKWATLRLVILPQALRLVIPGIVNSFISLFKDTTLVATVGIFDFLRIVDTARLDPAWAGPTITTSAYLFAGLFYWVFCFGMSRLSQNLERHLAAGQTR